MSFSDVFPTVFCACFAVAYSVVAFCMWRCRPEHFERYYLQYREIAPFSNDVTRGYLRAFAVGALPLFFLALAVGVGDVVNYREATGEPPSDWLRGLNGAFLILMFLGWGFQAIVSLFSWPRWLLLPYVRDEQSYWVTRREARARRRATRSSSSEDTSE